VSGRKSACEPYREWIEEEVRRHPAAMAIGRTSAMTTACRPAMRASGALSADAARGSAKQSASRRDGPRHGRWTEETTPAGPSATR